MSMTPAISRTLRSRWFTGCVHASFWLLLYLAITNLGGRAIEFRSGEPTSIPLQNPVPVSGLEHLFASDAWPKLLVDTNVSNAFMTRYFIPPQAAPPTTRKIEVTYQGFYETADGPKHAVCKLGDAFVATAVGAKVTANLFIADVTMQSLTLTNSTAQTNVLTLNVKKEIVVPLP